MHFDTKIGKVLRVLSH